MESAKMSAVFTVVCLVLMTLGASGAPAQEPSDKAGKDKEAEAIPGQYIVVLKEKAAMAVVKQQEAMARKQAAMERVQDLKPEQARAAREKKARDNKSARDEVLAKLKEVRGRQNVSDAAVKRQFADVLVGFSAKLSEAEVNSLKGDDDVEGVFQDYAVVLSPDTPEADPTGISATGDYTTCAVDKAGGAVDGSGKWTWIWVLDTGIDLDHPDLNVQTYSTFAKSFIAGETTEDGNGHGTHVAGIAAAKNNSYGIAGVSAGALVVPVKVLSNAGGGSFSGIIDGLNHVAQYDIANDVVNMSLGAYPVSNCENWNAPLRDAIRNLGAAGTHVVIAAGNSSGNAAYATPGCVNGTRVYTVGSVTCSLGCSWFSNWGQPPVDWAAVGSSVYSTYKNGGYATLSGTSMASPVIAGVIHARAAGPASGGTVSCGGGSYPLGRR